MRRGVLPLLLVLLALFVATWLATRGGDGAGSGDEIGRTAEDEASPPPMLRGTGEVSERAEPPVGTPPTSPMPAKPDAPPPTEASVEPVAGAATLVVRVVDEQGRPRSGLRIRLYVPIAGRWQFTHDVRLDATGEVRFDDAHPGPVYLWIDDAHGHRSRRLDLDAIRPTQVDVTVPVGGTITGTVRHLERGVLADLDVVVADRAQGTQATWRTRTDREGRYVLEGVTSGTHDVSLTGRSLDYNQRPRAQVTVSAGETVEQDIVLGRLMIEGRVRDAATGAPLPEVRVSVGSLYLPTTTDASGSFRVQDVPPGLYTLFFRRDGYLGRRSDEIQVVAGAVTRLEIDVQPAGLVLLRFRTPEGKAVTGPVRLSFEPVEGKGRSASPWSRTDGSGVVRCAQILPGTYTVHAQVEGYEVDARQVEVGASEEPVEVVCRPVAREGVPLLAGVVRDARTRAPLPGAWIRSEATQSEGAVTDEQGGYALWWTAGSPLRLIVSKDGYGIRFLRGIAVKPGETTAFDIELHPAAVVHLWLTDTRGQAVVGSVTLVVSPKERGEGLTSLGTGVTADARGHAEYREIVPGDYELTVIDEKAGRGVAEAVVRPGENTVRIQLKP